MRVVVVVFFVAQVVVIGLASWARSALLLALGEVLLLPLTGCVALGRRYALLLRDSAHERETSQREDDRRAVADDVHDLVGHELSLIAMQAGLLELRTSGPEAEVAAELRERAGAAIRALHETLELISPTRPGSRAVTQVEQIVGQFRDAGSDVALTGTPGEMTAPALVTTAWILREALSNAARHGPGRPVRVELRDVGEDLEIVVATLGADPPVPAPGSGRGLTSMQRRLASVNGTLAISHDAGGHTLTARLPRQVVRVERRSTSPRAVPVGDLLRQVAIPLLASAAVVLGLYWWASRDATIEPAAQARIKVGMPTVAANDLLPPRQAPIRLVGAPAHPPAWECRSYTNGNFPLAVATIQLCASHGVIVRISDLAAAPLW